MNESILRKRIDILEQRVAALEMVAQRYADLKPKLDQIHKQLAVILPVAQKLLQEKKGEVVQFKDEFKLN